MAKTRLCPKTYLIGSGKGGVGKSTVAVNLAISLAKQGLKVGLLDADIYGPSIPIMFGLRQLSPKTTKDPENREKVIPFTKYGVDVLSIGFFIEEARSVTWRGPLLHGALDKMLHGVLWNEMDIFLIDLPPGTGDIPMSLAGLLECQGAFIVCTPQEVAMIDAIKAVNAFYQLDIPLSGVIENMAGFTVPGTTQVYDIFGKGKAKELADKFNTPLIGSIPIIQAIREGGDCGVPCAIHQNLPSAFYFQQLACECIKHFLSPLPNPFI